MNTVHPTGDRHPGLLLWAGVSSIVQALVFFVPVIVLGAAINWPESLGDPASVALPRLLENEGAVRLGYIAYLFYSVLFCVTVILLAHVSLARHAPLLRNLIVAFAVASTVARSIGIVRWLGPMPEIAQSYADAQGEAQRIAIEASFEGLNAYGGTIGEVLGVGLFAAVALALLAWSFGADRSMPRWVGITGLIAAIAVLASIVEIAGVDPGSIVATVGVTIVQLWFLAVGAWLLVRHARA